MCYKNQNQLSLFAAETKKTYQAKKPNPFLLSEKVKRELFRRGYSHIFNYPEYQRLKKMSHGVDSDMRVSIIADLFIQETHEKSDFADYEF